MIPVFELSQEKTEQHWSRLWENLCTSTSGQTGLTSTFHSHFAPPFSSPLISPLYNLLPHHLLIWKPILTSKFIYVCPPFHKIYICLLFLKIYKCLNILPPPHILARISLRSVKLNQFDQVSALCTAWRWWMWRGCWWWRSEWSTAGASAARVVKVRGQGGERACGRWSILAQLCLSASSEPICLCWTCNAVSAPAYYLSP